MPQKQKEKTKSLAPAGSVIAILETLMSAEAYTPESAIHLDVIAKNVGEDKDLVEYELRNICTAGCVVVGSDTRLLKPASRFFIATQEGQIEEFSQSLRVEAMHLSGRAEAMERVLWSMRSCTPPWLFKKSS